MEKNKPHHDLGNFKAEAAAGNIGFTRTATRSFQALGLTVAEALETLATLELKDFYKSMTSYNDHTQWQDVYHKDTEYGERLYIKFTAGIVTDFVVLSFKERN